MIYQREEQVYKMMILRFSELVMKIGNISTLDHVWEVMILKSGYSSFCQLSGLLLKTGG